MVDSEASPALVNHDFPSDLTGLSYQLDPPAPSLSTT